MTRVTHVNPQRGIALILACSLIISCADDPSVATLAANEALTRAAPVDAGRDEAGDAGDGGDVSAVTEASRAVAALPPARLSAGADGEFNLDRSAPGPTLLLAGGSIYVVNGGDRTLLIGPSAFHRAHPISLRPSRHGTDAGATFDAPRGRVTIARGEDVREWYEPREQGLEQSWSIASPLAAGADRLRVMLPLGPDVSVLEIVGNRVMLDAGGIIIEYADLVATDNSGRHIETELLSDGSNLILSINDATATYPIEIDPWVIVSSSNLFTMDGSAPTSAFGMSMGVDSVHALVSEHTAPPTGALIQGRVHRYVGGATGWFRDGTSPIRMPIESGVTGPAFFGYSVDVAAGWAVITAPHATSNRGATYFVDLNGSFTAEGVPLGYTRIASPIALNGSAFGWSAAISSTRAVVGGLATSRAWSFTRSGHAWVLEAQFPPGGGTVAGLYGSAVDIDPLDSTRIVVGAPLLSTNGAVFVYHLVSGTWAVQQFNAPPGYTAYGTSVALFGGRLAVGATNTSTHRAEMLLSSWNGSSWPTPASALVSTGFVSADQAMSVGSSNTIGRVALSPNLRILGLPNSTRTHTSGAIQYGWFDIVGASGVELSWSGPQRYRGRAIATDGHTIVFSQESTTGFPAYAFALNVRQTNGSTCSSATDCQSGFCVDGMCCNNACGGASTSNCQACSVANGATTDGTCSAIRSGVTVVCRPASSGGCDIAEQCVPSSTACPSDAYQAASLVCRPAASACDAAETCTGSSPNCPANGYRPTGTVCLAASGVCDLDDVCTGSGPTCPARYAPSGQECRAAVLGRDGTSCDLAEQCNGASPTCPADALRPAGTTCRPAAGVCDLAETCSGSSATCSVDVFQAHDHICRVATPGALCGASESCSGAGPLCPPDGHLPAGSVCRAPVAPCDPADICTGATDACVGIGPASDCSAPPVEGGAPPLPPPSLVPSFVDSNAFLYRGNGPMSQVIDEERAVGIFGYVRERGGNPLKGVLVRVVHHDEFGLTTTGTNGRFDILANGGATLIVEFELTGYVPVQRTVPTGWGDYYSVGEVVLTPYESTTYQADGASINAISSGASHVQVAQGVVHGDGAGEGGHDDNYGPRQATLLFMPGTQAMASADGTSIPLGDLSVRATEMTFGGLAEAMPGELGFSTGFTYAVELSVDEAEAINATRVDFDRPVYFYLEDLSRVGTGTDPQLPVGRGVPTGWYDRSRGVWVPSESGRAIEILSIGGTPPLANIDADGDGAADSATQLAALNFTDEERRTLATLYTAGRHLWRVPIEHFTPYDCNWPYGPPDDAIPPKIDLQSGPNVKDCEKHGSIIRCESQVLGESIPIAGTPYSLSYSSERAPGRADTRTIRMPLDTASIIRAARVVVDVAGREYRAEWDRTHGEDIPPLFSLTWDGQDAFGRPQPTASARIALCYGYTPVYGTVANFDRFGAYQVTAVRASGSAGARVGFTPAPPIWICTQAQTTLGGSAGYGDALFGLNIDSVHFRRVDGQILRGDGQREIDEASAGAFGTVYETNHFAPYIGRYSNIAVAPDGSVLFTQGNTNSQDFPTEVWRVSVDGTNLTRVAGQFVAGGCASSSGGAAEMAYPDGAPALNTCLGIVEGIEVGPDGSIFVLDALSALGGPNQGTVLHRIDADGSIWRIAGNGDPAHAGTEGGSARDAYFDIQSTDITSPVAAVPDGSIYVLHEAATGGGASAGALRHIQPDGAWYQLFGWTSPATPPFPRPPTSICRSTVWDTSTPFIGVPWGVVASPNGTIYLSVEDQSGAGGWCIVRLEHDGTLTRVLGAGDSAGSRADGTPALAYDLSTRGSIFSFAASDTQIFFAEDQLPLRVVENGRVAALRAEGLVDTDIRLRVAGDGHLFGGSSGHQSIYRADLFPYFVSGQDVFRFDIGGRHLSTLDALTGVPILTLNRSTAIDTFGQLDSMLDADGNQVTIERLGASTIRIHPAIGPYTDITDTDADGWADSVAVAGRTWALEYEHNDGLLTSLTRPDGVVHTYEYDAAGLLVTDRQPDGRRVVLVGHGTASEGAAIHDRVDVISGSGLVTRHDTWHLADGGMRRQRTEPSGAQTTSEVTPATGASGGTTRTRTTSYADGTSVSTTELLDGTSRGWSDAIPITTSILRHPLDAGGLTLTRARTRTTSAGSVTPATENWTTTLRGGTETRTAHSSFVASARRFTITMPLSRELDLDYDAHGHVISVQASGFDPRGAEYDSRGRIASTYWGTPSSRSREVTYNYFDPSVGEVWQPARITDFEATTTRDWSSFFRIGSVSRTDQTLTFGYESGVSDRVVAVTPPGRSAHGQSWNQSDELATYSPPAVDGAEAPTTWSRDTDGRLSHIDLAGRGVDLVYDVAGRVSRVGYDLHSVVVGYDPATREPTSTTTEDGQVVTIAEDGPIPLSMTWSGASRVNGTVAFGHDSLWQRSSVTAAGASGSTTALMSYDSSGALTCVTINGTADAACLGGLQTALTLQGTPQTWRARTRYPGDPSSAAYVATQVDLSRFGEPTSASATWTDGAGRSGGLSFSYAPRDPFGRITALTETSDTGSGPSIHDYVYAYDTHDRLTDVFRDGDTIAREHYEYSANGNRSAATVFGRPTVTSADIVTDARDRLMHYGDRSFTYDDQGQLLTMTNSAGTTTYEYDALGALRRVALPGTGGVVTYRMDGMGRRVERAVNGTVSARWIYLDGLRPVAELDATNTVRAVFVYAQGRVPSLMIRDGVVYRMIADHLGSVRRVVGATTGEIVWSRDYDSFGNVTTEHFGHDALGRDITGSFIPFGFAGGMYDEATQLVRFGARDYDATIGRWTTRDPLLFWGGSTNLYTYCSGNPVGYVDPTGRYFEVHDYGNGQIEIDIPVVWNGGDAATRSQILSDAQTIWDRPRMGYDFALNFRAPTAADIAAGHFNVFNVLDTPQVNGAGDQAYCFGPDIRRQPRRDEIASIDFGNSMSLSTPAHEIGHLLGLEHDDDMGNLMYHDADRDEHLTDIQVLEILDLIVAP